MSLMERAREGLRELPSNAGWVLTRVLETDAVKTAESAAGRAREGGRKLTEVAIDAAPFGGDPVQTKMKHAQEAAEGAREAEIRAVEAAEEAKARADYAREVSARGRARLKEVERETSRLLEQRVKQAEKEAEETLRRLREVAEADAERERREAYSEVEDETTRAQREAEASQQEAEERVADAREKLAEARRLAEEAAEAARAASEEATRHAQQLAAEAEQHANDAEARVAIAEQFQQRSEATVTRTARQLEKHPTNGDLQSYTKRDLTELAATIGIEGRSQMTKPQLVSAIRRASRDRR